MWSEKAGNGEREYWLGRGTRELSGVVRMFYTFIGFGVTHVCTHQNLITVYLRLLHFIIYKFYIEREKL